MPVLRSRLKAQATASFTPVTTDFVQQAVESLGAIVEREYMDAAVGAQVQQQLRARLAAGRYNEGGKLEDLARLLTADLYSLTKDKHLAVSTIPVPVPGAATAASAQESREVRARRFNFGMQRVEVLSGNVGYLNITGFERAELAREAISLAMGMLRHADALIVDLRVNGGGAPDGVALVASYFFEQPSLALFEIIPRSGSSGKEYRTEARTLPGGQGSRPMYVLTAASTFSAGEGLAFLLQERGRAEVVGETTAGAANPGRPYPINERLQVTVPNGKVRSAVKRGNWEGTGVIPDVKAPAIKALAVAHTRALSKLIEAAPVGPWRARLEAEFKAIGGSTSER